MNIEKKSIAIITKLSLFSKQAQMGGRRGLIICGSHLVKDERAHLLGIRSGRLYYFNGTLKRASSEIEYPAKRTGNLRDSVASQVEGNSILHFGFNNSVNYGKWLEFGTVHMKPRNPLIKTITRLELRMENIIAKEITKAVTQ